MSKSNPLLCTHVDSYMFDTLHPPGLLLGLVQTLACVVVERQWTSNVVREKVMSSHLLLAHVGNFVIVSVSAFHDLDIF